MVRPRAARVCRHAPDTGFTLVEVMVAMVIFVLVSTATVTILIQGLKSIRENTDRVVAANIARAQLDYWRSVGPTGIPLGLTVGAPAGADLAQVFDPDFAIRTTANWVGIGQTASACVASDPQQAYMRVSVAVEGRSMAVPVTLDTVVFAEAATASGTTGTVVVFVIDERGSPVSDVRVVGTDASHSANNFSYYTGSDGCLFIPGRTAPATIQIVISRAGFVSSTPTGATGTVPVEAGVASKLTLRYAAAASLQFSTGEATYAYPPTMPVTWQVNATGSSTNAATAGVTVTDLWPTTAGVTAWAACSAPQVFGSLTAGATTAITLPAARVKIRGLPQDVAVTGTCGTTTVALGSTNSLGILKVGLPYGLWSFTSTGQTQVLADPLAAPPQADPDEVVRVDFTLADLDGASPTPTPTVTPTPTPTPTP